MASARREGGEDDVPSMLDLVRLSPRLIYPPGGVALARQIALLTDMGEGDEVLVVGCGKGVTLEHFVREYGVRGSGVEHDPRLVAEGTDRLRDRELATLAQVQQGDADHLPYRDEIFDVTIGEIGMTAHATAADAVREIVRVTRTGGAVVLVQPVWKAPVDEDRRTVLSEHLGVRPQMLVEWKRLLRAHGVEEILVEDWSDAETAFRGNAVKPFPDFAEIFSIPEKLGILRRAWRRWGWAGVRTVVAREREVHRLLTRERVLGFDLLKGVRGEDVTLTPSTPSEEESATPADEESATSAVSTRDPSDHELTLFDDTP
ncbi:MAG: methyltransferase domain-containing protein [Longimicrobiales bacterium]|nr:methyltransferase domain-containing protein [Longimicrobiales bacterium]